MDLRRVYVTVGSTKFESLIDEVVSAPVLRVLKARGCQELVLQLGRGRPVLADQIQSVYGIHVDQHDFKIESPRSDIVNADLVIGHGGAGTCMDILKHGKPGLIVINQKLMDNHQSELVLQLDEDGYLYYCNIGQLAKRLANIDPQALRPYNQRRNMDKFVRYLDEMMTC